MIEEGFGCATPNESCFECNPVCEKCSGTTSLDCIEEPEEPTIEEEEEVVIPIDCPERSEPTEDNTTCDCEGRFAYFNGTCEDCPGCYTLSTPVLDTLEASGVTT